jgi:peptidoglycan/xylan/chitin deacetylase (PgdA/CDA1 family)
MKAVMYHYVRPSGAALPCLHYLPLDSFRRQLDHLQAAYKVASARDFASALSGAELAGESLVLTFDDGLSDHYQYVLPELVARGLWAIFYVCTGPYSQAKLLDVHKVHLALGSAGGARVLRELMSLLSEDMLQPEYVARLDQDLYRGHVEDSATAQVKRLLNFHVRLEHRSRLCGEVFLRTGGDERLAVQAHYASVAQLRELRAAGMTVGAHSVTHRVLSQLSDAEQASEVMGSVATLRELLGERVETFCFPHGGAHTFTPHTLELLTAAGIEYCFSVEPRDIRTDDFRHQRLALPRHDCNAFPHGQSVLGGPAA